MKQRLLKTAILLVWVAALAGYLFTMRKMMFPNDQGAAPPTDEMMALQTRGTVLLLFGIAFTFWVYYVLIIKSSLTETAKNILLSAAVLLAALLGAECFFLHRAESNAIGERWSYKLWDRKYMNHRTSFYYTDSRGEKQRADLREPLPTLNNKKKSIWFIGDSFTFGFGIEQTAQTFPALVQEHLKGQADCINLGDGGADTYREKETLFAFDGVAQQPPAAVVWQYFGNDIDFKDEGPDIHEKEITKNAWVRFGRKYFQAKSFLLDYIYWEYFTGNEQGSVPVYIDFLNNLYRADSMVVNGITLKDSLGYITPYRQHLEPLKEAAAYYKSKGVKFLVIIFPYLWRDGPENAERLYAHRLENELKAENTDVINLTPLVKDFPVEKRVINSHDPHPSVLVVQITADTIAKYFMGKYGW